jgi:hypothetical protein
MYRQVNLDKQMSQISYGQIILRHTESTDKYCRRKIKLDEQISQINIVYKHKKITDKYLTKQKHKEITYR